MAEHQVQLDMFGPIVELIWQLAKGGTVIDDRLWRVTCDLVDAVTRRWHEPDHGIWEERRARRSRLSAEDDRRGYP